MEWKSISGVSPVCPAGVVYKLLHVAVTTDIDLLGWLSFVMSVCDVVTFWLVSWVRCGAWMYWFLIFAHLLTWTPWNTRVLLFLVLLYVVHEVLNGCENLKIIYNAHSSLDVICICSCTSKILASQRLLDLTHKAPPTICSRQQFQILPLFQK